MKFANEYKDFIPNRKIAGIDEAGRGPLAGPVCVAAVILNPAKEIVGLNDSKKLSESKRELLFDEIIEKAYAWHIEFVKPNLIDELNILQATLFGMKMSAERLANPPDFCLIDGNKIPENFKFPVLTVVKGDGKYSCIAAASILAKVARDRYMSELDMKYPMYNFKQNKGYPTKQHLLAIEKYGICPEHRKSYKPVQQLSFQF